jgi:trans-aconitate 2-methyltransferase
MGVDLSQNMLRAAQEHLRTDFGGRLSLVVADLQCLPFEHAFDGIVSTAAFHWVLDHETLFASLRSVLRAGGWLHAQCGGASNLARLRERILELVQSPQYAPYLASFREPWFFADAEQAADILRRAGFTNIETSIEAAPTLLDDARQYEEFVRNIILRSHLRQLPSEELRSRLMAELTTLAGADDPPYLLDYWRLNLSGKIA